MPVWELCTLLCRHRLWLYVFFPFVRSLFWYFKVSRTWYLLIKIPSSGYLRIPSFLQCIIFKSGVIIPLGAELYKSIRKQPSHIRETFLINLQSNLTITVKIICEIRFSQQCNQKPILLTVSLFDQGCESEVAEGWLRECFQKLLRNYLRVLRFY